MSTYADLAAWLTNARKARRLSQRDVARLMGNESAASLCQWETGAKRPRADHLVAWAAALDYAVTLVPLPALAPTSDPARCADIDPIWDRRCESGVGHAGVHQNTEVAGDTVTWGTADQVRAAERSQL